MIEIDLRDSVIEMRALLSAWWELEAEDDFVPLKVLVGGQ